MGVFEGCVFDNVPDIVESGFVGLLFSSEAADVSQCVTYLGRDCVTNLYINSGPFSYDDDKFFVDFSGRPIPPAVSASSIQSNVPAAAGNTLQT
jgi:pectin lyase